MHGGRGRKVVVRQLPPDLQDRIAELEVQLARDVRWE